MLLFSAVCLADRDEVLAILRGRDRAVIHDLAATPPHSYAIRRLADHPEHWALLDSYYPSRGLLLGHDADWRAIAGWVWVLQDDRARWTILVLAQ